MNKILIQLGRMGDILNLLPLLHKDSLSGAKPKLMVAAEYASLLDGVSYVDPVIYNGPHYEIDKAVAQAKASGYEPLVCQVNGPAEVVAKHTYQAAGQNSARTTSYQKEQWRILGRQGEWDDLLPLIFDRRDKKREEKLLRDNGFIIRGKRKPIILLSLGGSSSPFQHAELLRQLVKTRFAETHRIVELPQAERIYDLLALYERAQLLIATDSAPLHLAWACRKLPVFALANDKPLLWNGSSWRPNHHWYCRYSDFPTRAMEMLWEIEQLPVYRTSSTLLHVWSEYETKWENRVNMWGDPLPIRIGMCGRDSQNTLQDSKRVPYLKDVIRMAIQRCDSRDCDIVLTRPNINISRSAKEVGLPCFAYRITESAQGQRFRPVVDMFAATRFQWKSMLPDIPDLLLSADYMWSQCLWAVFKKYGAKDETGICTREATVPKPVEHTKTRDHNDHLCAEYMAKSKVYSRYPKLSEQAQTIPIEANLLPKGAYNPSICRVNGKLLMTYRYHPEPNFNTRIGIAELSETFAVLKTRELALEGESQEDARLFSLHGEPWLSWTDAWRIGWPGMRCVVKYAKLEEWKAVRIHQNKVGGNDGSNLEKNWVYFESDENLFCLYHSYPTQIILHAQGNVVINENKTEGKHWPYGVVRGGAILPVGDQLLRFFHSSLDNELGATKRRYYIGATLLKNKPPFQAVAISRKPILYGSEIDMMKPAERKAIHHHKPNVVFPCGAAIDGHGFVLSVGVNDSACSLVKLKMEDLNL